MFLLEAHKHVFFQHGNADGWVTLAKADGDNWRQYHYKANELTNVLSEWLGIDTYILQNTLYKPERRIENIKQFRACYLDLDCYLLNMVPGYVIDELEKGYFQRSVPEPNLIIHSGRGINLIWLIEPVPYNALPLWMAVQRYLVAQLKGVGVDSKATDPVRVFRLAGSVNSKNDARVTVEYRHNLKYTLRQIQEEYLPEIKPRKGQKSKSGQSAKVHKLFNVYTLHGARLFDITKLVELRNYNVTGYREIILFLYRYWSCCFLSDPGDALRQTLEINESFTEPLPHREVVKATESAEKAWTAKNDQEADRLAREKGYPGAGYNISNKKLISWLDITEDEQRGLTTIIGRKEKYRREREKDIDKVREQDRKRQRKAREKAGSSSRNDYLVQAEKRRQDAVRMHQEGLKQKEIAEALKISLRHVRRLLEQS
ncbi:hypothetical protein JCM14036_02850 [Desulfotomaculum defluvii]